MGYQEDLLRMMDLRAREGYFPMWRYDSNFFYTGSMQASGFVSSAGKALVFEAVEFAFTAGTILCNAYCFATFPISGNRRQSVNGIYVPWEAMFEPETGEFCVDFGVLQIVIRERTFDVLFDRDELISQGYLSPEAKSLTEEAVLFKICDTIPKDWLYSDPSAIQNAFGMGEDARRLFCLEEWEHMSMEIFDQDPEPVPSDYSDIGAMVTALCSGDSSPKLVGTPNTSWRVLWPQWKDFA